MKYAIDPCICIIIYAVGTRIVWLVCISHITSHKFIHLYMYIFIYIIFKNLSRSALSGLKT